MSKYEITLREINLSTIDDDYHAFVVDVRAGTHDFKIENVMSDTEKEILHELATTIIGRVAKELRENFSD
jgi:hypothetical protein